jgi:fucose permease
MLADLTGCLLSIALIILWSGSFAATLAGTIGLGLSMASIFPTTIALAERRITITGQVTGWFIIGASTGAMLLPWLIGQFFETTGPRVMMLIIITTLVAAAGVLILLLSASQAKMQES